MNYIQLFNTDDRRRAKAELAAWTSIARLVLNLHVNITRN